MLRGACSTVLLLGCLAHGSNAYAVDLLSVVEQTTDRDADLAASRAGAKAARQAVPKARAALLPQLGGGWGRAYNSIRVQEFPRTSYWQNGWTVNLTQTVFDWSSWKTLKQAGVIEARGAVEVAQAQQASILRAVQAYFDALGAEDELERVTNYAATLAGHLEEVRRKRVAGEATVIDLRDAETGLQQAQLQQLDARQDLQLKRLALEQMTGQPFAGLSRLSKSVPMPRLDPEDADSWAAQAEAHDYGVQLKQLDWRIAKLEVEKARAGHLPTVSLTASHTPSGAASGYSRPTTTTTAMLSISIPLFEGGGTVARVDESVALADRAQNELLSATRQAGQSARENGLRFRAGASRIGSLTRLVESSRVALEATQIGYRVGSRTGIDVLRAADVFYQAGRDLIKARYETLVALLQLQGTTATLDFEVVARVNAMLVPAAGAVLPQTGGGGGAGVGMHVVQQVPQVSQMPQVVSQAQRVPQMPQVVSQVPQVSQVVSQAPQVSQMPQVVSQGPQAPQMPQVVSQAPQVPQVAQAQQVAQVPEASQIPRVSDIPRVSQIPQASQGPQVLRVPGM